MVPLPILFQAVPSMIYAAPFEADDEPTGPINFDAARGFAVADPSLASSKGEILRMFHEGKGKVQFSICLAIRFGNKWLYVDQKGTAMYAGHLGHFDVLAWERLLRRKKFLLNALLSTLTQVKIQNQTTRTLTLIDGAGFVRAAVGGRSIAVITTWESPHQIWIGKTLVGVVNSPFQRLRFVGARSTKVTLTDMGRFQEGHGPGGSGTTYAATLVVR